MEIDWSNAPEGATHYRKYGHGMYPWYRISEQGKEYWGGGGWNKSTVLSGADLETRPTFEWDGEGLPPVGTVCESMWNESRNEWLRIKVFGVNEHGQPIFRWEDGPKKYEYQASPLCGFHAKPYFRPIRTPEQIAAENRLHEVRNALSAIHAGQHFPSDLVRGNIVAATVKAMIDAGYRKQDNL